MIGNMIDIYLWYGALRACTESKDMQDPQWNVAGCRRARSNSPKSCSRRNGQVSQRRIYYLGPCRHLWPCRGLCWSFQAKAARAGAAKCSGTDKMGARTSEDHPADRTG